MEAAQHFKIPVYVSEQYPKGLGHTTKDIKLDNAKLVYEKTKFSMVTPELQCKLKDDVPELQSVVIFGIEVCFFLFISTRFHYDLQTSTILQQIRTELFYLTFIVHINININIQKKEDTTGTAYF